MSETSPLETVKSSALKPVRGKPWAQGVSGNPQGRPRKLDALADAIRWGADARELVEIALKIARTSRSEAMRMQALAWLSANGYAKPAERHELAVERSEAHSFDHLSLERRKALLAELRGDDPRLAEPPVSDGEHA